MRSIYDIADPDLAREFVGQLGLDLQDESCPEEVQSLGRTLRRWLDQITNWHHAGVSNGPTEAINGLIKRIKRIGFGFRNLRNYRTRALLYAGRPNWDLLATIEPPLTTVKSEAPDIREAVQPTLPLGQPGPCELPLGAQQAAVVGRSR